MQIEIVNCKKIMRFNAEELKVIEIMANTFKNYMQNIMSGIRPTPETYWEIKDVFINQISLSIIDNIIRMYYPFGETLEIEIPENQENNLIDLLLYERIFIFYDKLLESFKVYPYLPQNIIELFKLEPVFKDLIKRLDNDNIYKLRINTYKYPKEIKEERKIKLNEKMLINICNYK